ncbi:hypothetical protein [Alistipes sp.]|uniref:hypothetical protein n=1 Tax=Alistipes sp. TaxID=1872444 RepID=UPI003AF00225
MKRFLTILSVLLLFTTVSCSEDDAPSHDELVGSVWSQTDGNRTDTFYFALDNKCTYEWEIGNFDPVKQEYRYSFKAPTVTIETGANTYTGRIEGDVLSIRVFDQDLTLKKIR